jgi:hypothetical protein
MEKQMSRFNRLALAGLTMIGWPLAAMTIVSEEGSGAWAAEKSHVSTHKIETVAGTTDKRITLTPKAAQRLDIQTGQISLDPAGGKIAPYQSVFFDLAGVSWLYTNPEPLAFIKRKIAIAEVRGDKAYLSDGPPEGTTVVTVGVAELYGAERGIGH